MISSEKPEAKERERAGGGDEKTARSKQNGCGKLPHPITGKSRDKIGEARQGAEKMSIHGVRTDTHMVAVSRRLKTIREQLDSIEELLKPIEDSDHGQPVIDETYRRVTVGTTTATLPLSGVRLLMLLLNRAGQEVSLAEIDMATRAPEAGYCQPVAINQAVARIKKKLRQANLHDLADAIQAGAYRSYLMVPFWRVSKDTQSCQRQCHHSRGKLEACTVHKKGQNHDPRPAKHTHQSGQK